MGLIRIHLAKSSVVGFLVVYVAALSYTVLGLGQSGTDFGTYYLAVKAIEHGNNVYEMSDTDWSSLAQEYQVERYQPPYRYSPLVAGLVSLFGSASSRVALAIWNTLSILALAATGLALSKFISHRWIDPAVFVTLTIYVPNLTTVYGGQANNFVLLTLTLYLLWSQSKRVLAAGLSLAAGIVLKPIAAPLIAYPIWRRDLKQIVALIVGLLVTVAGTIVLTGPQVAAQYVQNLWNVTAPSAGIVTFPPNQSIFGFFGRAFTVHEYGPSLGNLPELARLLAITLSALLVLGVAFLTWPRKNGEPSSRGLEVGLIMVTINLIIPTTWYHHMVISCIALIAAWQATTSWRSRFWLLAALVLINAQGLLWHQFVGQTFLLSLGTYGLLILYAVTAAQIVYTLRVRPSAI